MITRLRQFSQTMEWKSAPRNQVGWAVGLRPEGILFIGDNVGAAIFAVDVGDSDDGGKTHAVNMANFDSALASYLGCSREDVAIKDMAVHPTSDNLYFSVMRGVETLAYPS